ncbi:ATP-binding protein [Absiella sp. AM29-15]|uniref:ATP-binding protein n=1 Tax=Absiella sp. AM29-15 TaxID=2292278 RepID=UPI000E3FC394|nr:ATP-binding protein [Absiella sp. AM29-15]RGC49134.1 ATP-binding protein [Absiella sp. AM29-15]
MIERPQYVNEIMKYMDKPFVKILTGVRRSGKLTIMLMIKEQLRQKGILQIHGLKETMKVFIRCILRIFYC